MHAFNAYISKNVNGNDVNSNGYPSTAISAKHRDSDPMSASGKTAHCLWTKRLPTRAAS
jgi:hypothetical protein